MISDVSQLERAFEIVRDSASPFSFILVHDQGRRENTRTRKKRKTGPPSRVVPEVDESKKKRRKKNSSPVTLDPLKCLGLEDILPNSSPLDILRALLTMI